MENRPTLMEDFNCVHVDRSTKSTNFQYKATLMCKWLHPSHTLSVKFKPDLALQTLQEEHMCDLIVFAVLYCMAYDILKQTM